MITWLAHTPWSRFAIMQEGHPTGFIVVLGWFWCLSSPQKGQT